MLTTDENSISQIAEVSPIKEKSISIAKVKNTSEKDNSGLSSGRNVSGKSPSRLINHNFNSERTSFNTSLPNEENYLKLRELIDGHQNDSLNFFQSETNINAEQFEEIEEDALESQSPSPTQEEAHRPSRFTVTHSIKQNITEQNRWNFIANDSLGGSERVVGEPLAEVARKNLYSVLDAAWESIKQIGPEREKKFIASSSKNNAKKTERSISKDNKNGFPYIDDNFKTADSYLIGNNQYVTDQIPLELSGISNQSRGQQAKKRRSSAVENKFIKKRGTDLNSGRSLNDGSSRGFSKIDFVPETSFGDKNLQNKLTFENEEESHINFSFFGLNEDLNISAKDNLNNDISQTNGKVRETLTKVEENKDESRENYSSIAKNNDIDKISKNPNEGEELKLEKQNKKDDVIAENDSIQEVSHNVSEHNLTNVVASETNIPLKTDINNKKTKNSKVYSSRNNTEKQAISKNTARVSSKIRERSSIAKTNPVKQAAQNTEVKKDVAVINKEPRKLSINVPKESGSKKNVSNVPTKIYDGNKKENLAKSTKLIDKAPLKIVKTTSNNDKNKEKPIKSTSVIGKNNKNTSVTKPKERLSDNDLEFTKKHQPTKDKKAVGSSKKVTDSSRVVTENSKTDILNKSKKSRVIAENSKTEILNESLRESIYNINDKEFEKASIKETSRKSQTQQITSKIHMVSLSNSFAVEKTHLDNSIEGKALILGLTDKKGENSNKMILLSENVIQITTNELPIPMQKCTTQPLLLNNKIPHNSTLLSKEQNNEESNKIASKNVTTEVVKTFKHSNTFEVQTKEIQKPINISRSLTPNYQSRQFNPSSSIVFLNKIEAVQLQNSSPMRIQNNSPVYLQNSSPVHYDGRSIPIQKPNFSRTDHFSNSPNRKLEGNFKLSTIYEDATKPPHYYQNNQISQSELILSQKLSPTIIENSSKIFTFTPVKQNVLQSGALKTKESLLPINENRFLKSDRVPMNQNIKRNKNDDININRLYSTEGNYEYNMPHPYFNNTPRVNGQVIYETAEKARPAENTNSLIRTNYQPQNPADRVRSVSPNIPSTPRTIVFDRMENGVPIYKYL